MPQSAMLREAVDFQVAGHFHFETALGRGILTVCQSVLAILPDVNQAAFLMVERSTAVPQENPKPRKSKKAEISRIMKLSEISLSAECIFYHVQVGAKLVCGDLHAASHSLSKVIHEICRGNL